MKQKTFEELCDHENPIFADDEDMQADNLMNQDQERMPIPADIQNPTIL
jgi:hypothetical protein